MSLIAMLVGMGLSLTGAMELLDGLGGSSRETPDMKEGRDDHALTFMEHGRLTDGRCPVCAKAFEAAGLIPVRICNRCQVPMHPECWSYQGGCAIFGCRSEGVAPASPEGIRATERSTPAPRSAPHPDCR